MRMLCAVVESGTMSAAAERLGYSIGAISQQMAGLQQEAGTPLFIKDGRSLSLSDAGHLLHRHAQTILAAEAAASSALEDLANGVDSTVRLGIFGSGALACAAPAIKELRNTDPHIRVRMQELDPDAMVAAVVAGTVDLALGLEYSGLPLPVPVTVAKRTILTEPLRVVFPEARGAHTGAEGVAGDPAWRESLAELGSDAEWLLPPQGTTFGRAARLALMAEGIEAEALHTVVDTALSLGLCAAGFGHTVATQTMLDFHRTGNPSIALPANHSRKMVTLARNAVISRPSVARVESALWQAAEKLPG
nr:LysR family transcriptional regulator [Arthrobacter sp. SF27]